MVSSRAMDSTQPMSLPLAFQPGLSFHAAHWLPRMTPIPQSVEASTQTFGSTDLQGSRDLEFDGFCRMDTHYVRLSWKDLGT